MSAQSGLSIFEFENHDVRWCMIDGAPWFVGRDVCRVMGIKNTSSAFARLDDDEKGECTTLPLSKTARGGGEQETIIINEAGVYHLAFASRLGAAKRFRRWFMRVQMPYLRSLDTFEGS